MKKDVLWGVQRDLRDHLGMAVLQPPLEICTSFFPLDGVVDGFFLGFVRHLCFGLREGRIYDRVRRVCECRS